MAVLKRYKRLIWMISIVFLCVILFVFIMYLNERPGGFSDRRMSKALGMTGSLHIPLGKTPEEAVFRGNVTPYRVIHQEPVDEGVIIFMNRPEKENTNNLQVEYVRKTLFGWKWVWGGGFGTTTVTNSALSYMSMPKLNKVSTPFPMIFGNVLDSSIKSITAEIKESGVHKAKLIKIDSEKTIWFVFLPSSAAPPFEIKGFNQEGELIADKIINDVNDSNNIKLIN